MTPLMQQYWEIKSAHEDKLLFFRMGDFFEMFYKDAETAAPILGIALTCRNRKAADETPMCGVPHHSVATPINKLLNAGYKVAICDQIEDPKEAKGIVKRAVTRILSPGMVYDSETLDGTISNYICSYDDHTMAFIESTTGEAFYFEVTPAARRSLMLLLMPVEVVVGRDDQPSIEIPVHLSRFDGFAEGDHLPFSVRRLIGYAISMQGEEILRTLAPFEKRVWVNRVELTSTVLRHLEIFQSYRGEIKGTLFHAINRTRAAGGARLLKQWLTFPLLDLVEIEDRQNHLSHWIERGGDLKEIRSLLSELGDLERRVGKLSHPQCTPRDLWRLADALEVAIEISQLSQNVPWPKDAIAQVQEAIRWIRGELVEDPPLAVKSGGVVRSGVSSELDRVVDLATNSQRLLTELESREREATKISSLKIKYNNIFGYSFEVTHAHRDKVPAHYHRKQTLAQAERYITEELRDLEREILSATSKRVELETALFSSLRARVLGVAEKILPLAKICNEIDVVTSLAWLSMERGYVRPTFGEDLFIKSSRHPVVEQSLDRPFVANDIELERGHVVVLTGPNMAGKSTLMRQVATTLIMAQMGSYVPAKEARLPLVDRIFTRVGASDYLSEGLSTFMVEMTETAEMLKEATDRSFIILDEIGRGTSTYDGLSLAQSILEFLIQDVRATVMFATHYHELSTLTDRFKCLENWHMSIREKGTEMSFLYTLKKGAANRSYGIQVARLAGLPQVITERATAILKSLESRPQASLTSQLSLLDYAADAVQDLSNHEESLQLEVRERQERSERLLRQIQEFSVSQRTPLEALNQISQWQQEHS